MRRQRVLVASRFREERASIPRCRQRLNFRRGWRVRVVTIRRAYRQTGTYRVSRCHRRRVILRGALVGKRVGRTTAATSRIAPWDSTKIRDTLVSYQRTRIKAMHGLTGMA